MQILFVSIFCLLPALLSARIFKFQRDLEQYLENIYEKNSNLRCTRFQTALWNYETNLNDTNKEEIFENVSLIQAAAIRKEWEENFKNLIPKKTWSDKIKRQISFAKKIGINALETKDYKNLTNIIKNMTLALQYVKICPFKKKKCTKSETLSLEPELRKRMQESRNSEELLYIWSTWGDIIGTNVKKQFSQYVELSNKAAELNEFKDTGHMWRSEYESSSLYDQINDLWDEVRYLYNELHTFALKRMRKIYDRQIDFDDGLIPAHILGDMWAQDWTHLSNVLKPYPKYSTNITKELKNQNYDVIDMFRRANSFYTSMGLHTNEMAYDSYAMVQRPVGRKVDCRPRNFDFCDQRHYRMKMCANVTQTDFLEIHLQMAQIQYFQQYKDQPYLFRGSVNPAFVKAIGGAIALSVATPSYLQRIRLLKDYKNTHENAMNRLMDIALQEVASLPYNLLVDKWRWDVFRGEVKEKWNFLWWKYREYYQKVKPPVPRNNDKFDPGAQFYLVDGLHPMDNFIATILQFQIYKALCIKSGQYDPKSKSPALNKCDFSKSREAGDALKSGLQLGKSKHWKDVLITITGEDDFDASALLEYFEPLYDYLTYSNAIQKESNSTKKPPKKKKKKKKNNKKNNKKGRERERVELPIEYLDFDEESFEDDDEDFHDTTDTDFVSSPFGETNKPWLSTINTLSSFTTTANDNVTSATIINDFTEDEESTTETSTIFYTTKTQTFIESNTIRHYSSDVPTSVTVQTVTPFPASTTKNYSVDIVYHRIQSTTLSSNIEAVTSANKSTRKIVKNNGESRVKLEIRLSILLLLIVFV